MGLPMQPRAGKFFALFTKASPDVVQSAAIVMESVAAPYGHWAEIANRMHDAEHAGDDTTKPDGRAAGGGQSGSTRRTSIRNNPRSRTLVSSPCRAA